MDKTFLDFLANETEKLHTTGLYKPERVITSPQGAIIYTTASHEKPLINLCANNYLGLANHPQILKAAVGALKKYGYGMSSVRFICGTQSIHKQLENSLTQFLGTEDTILYSSCFDANTGLFETILGEEDCVISDSLNHASIIDGIRLCKAKRLRYSNNDMQDLEQKLKESRDARFRLIVTDGVFSMDGSFADLPKICRLAEDYQSIVMVDDSHAVGFMGTAGRGMHEYWQVMDKVDILTGTLGKALGGASGGYTSGRKEIIHWLRQRSRPYLFSNSLAPVIAATSIEVLNFLQEDDSLKSKLMQNTKIFREGLRKLGFTLIPGEHPIIPVMLNDAKLASKMAEQLLQEGVYVISFSYPVVPLEKARIRTQISAAHSNEELAKALEAFAKVGRQLGVIA